MMSKPRVFEDGTITFVLSQDGQRAYVGQSEITGDFVMSSTESGKMRILLSSEEDMRLLQPISWVESKMKG